LQEIKSKIKKTKCLFIPAPLLSVLFCCEGTFS
jgi:hypothetical protein